MNIATYLKIKRNRLHEKIGEFEEGNNLEFHRFTPLRSPTVVLTGISENCAGRNSIDRYCLATGLKAKELGMTRNTVDFAPISNFQSRVSLPIKVSLSNYLKSRYSVCFDVDLVQLIEHPILRNPNSISPI